MNSSMVWCIDGCRKNLCMYTAVGYSNTDGRYIVGDVCSLFGCGNLQTTPFFMMKLRWVPPSSNLSFILEMCWSIVCRYISVSNGNFLFSISSAASRCDRSSVDNGTV